MSTQTHHGSCHCGRVTFQVDLDLDAGTGRCNCTFCLKARHWATIVKPAAFKLLSGEADLSDYRGRNPHGHNYFCKHCGVRPYSTGHVAELGGDYVSVSVSCLDDVAPEVLVAGKITYFDGRNNAWMQQPHFVGHL